MKSFTILLTILTFSIANPFTCAYKSKVSHIKNNKIYFKDGSFLIYDRKNPHLDINSVDMEDMIKLPYVTDKSKTINDAGRYRNEEFFRKIYGKDKKEIEKNLIRVKWFKGSVKFNKQNGAAKALKRVYLKLKNLDKIYEKFLYPIMGTYAYRTIKNTKRLSPHAFGIAIDLNSKYGSYWQWSKVYKNKIPNIVIEIFEKNGFIWGGRWKHFDTFHFEYRPEFTCK